MLRIIVIIEIENKMCYNNNYTADMGVLMTRTKKKPAFTLAEVMIVLLVLTILFAAFAPFVTKRRRNSAAKQEFWMWSSRNYMAGPMNTYYKPISDNYLGGIYIGTTPDSENDIKSSYTPLSKVIIRSGYVANNLIQRQLQLRYGRNDFNDPGQLAATFIADNTNLLFGANFPMLQRKESDTTYPSNNVAFGFNAMNGIKDYNDINSKADNNTAFGNDSLPNTYSGDDNTAIGARTGYANLAGYNNTFIGYDAGSEAETRFSTLIGYHSQSLTGDYNTLIGAYTGFGDECPTCEGSRDFQYNVAVGYKALSSVTSGKYNVAIGSGALGALTTGGYNTAIGYNACAGITGQSYKTCIGANSGPASNTPVNTELAFDKNDATPRTYIGSNPNLNNKNNSLTDSTWKSSGRYGGDAVLEIHNSGGYGNNKLINNPVIQSNATTIINGNLIVRGKTYLTMGNILYPFYYQNNIFGTNKDVSCAANQITYNFSNAGECATLEPITSDRRLKNILSKNTNGLDKIKQLKVYNYKFKNDKKQKRHVGVIAQDLEKVFPNSVFKGDDGFLKIKLDEMFYAVINSIKELNEKIVSLTKSIISLEKEITEAEKENSKLKTQVDLLTARVNKLKNK